MSHQVISFNFPENFPIPPHLLEVVNSSNFADWWDDEGHRLFDGVSLDLAHTIFGHCKDAFVAGLQRGLQEQL